MAKSSQEFADFLLSSNANPHTTKQDPASGRFTVPLQSGTSPNPALKGRGALGDAMRMAIWVATFALMLGVTSAHAQESKPTDIPPAATPATSAEVVPATTPAPTEAKEPADVPLATEATTTGSCGEKPCYLHQAHYKALQEQIAAKQAEITALGERLSKAEAATADDRTESREYWDRSIEQRNVIEKQLEQAVEQLQQLNLHASAAAALRLDPPWAGWHWGLNLQGQYQVGTDAAVFVPVQLGVFGRWVSQEHLGVEAGVASGVWFTEKWAPPMVSGHIEAVASWEHWGAFIGPQLAVLHSTYDKGGMFTQVAVQGGGEFKAGGFHLRAWLAPAISSPVARTSGIGLGVSLGYYQ